jgi:hypothetical protein
MKRIILSFLFLGLAASLSLQAQDLHTRQAKLPCLGKKFTIVAHIVQDSLGNPSGQDLQDLQDLINDRIANTNTHFAPICASFEVCEFKTIENFQYYTVDTENEWEQMQVKYNLENRINMYFVDDSYAGLECGFATQEGIGILDSGGVVVHVPCLSDISKAIPHQLGHFFGLFDTAETELFGEELVTRDTNNCKNTGDLLCDTPADPLTTDVIASVNAYIDVGQGCRFIFEGKDANSLFYIPDVGNIMSFYPDECRCGFSYEQLLKMARIYRETADKMW